MNIDLGFDFKGLVVFDIANNHQGDIDHGRNIIKAMGELSKKHNVRGVMKFQFRQLDSFIHPDHQKESDNKHIPRFLSTALSVDQYCELHSEARNQGLLTMCTPFDEASVEVIEKMGFDIIKIASCSASDWPLIERVAISGLPVIVSTGGLTIAEIDSLNSFFQHKGVDFAIMHCISVYPSPVETLELNQIDLLRKRYPEVQIGWSTHEDPDELGAVQIAVAKGAQLYERHVGIETDKITLNAYSSTPDQVDRWLDSLNKARKMCGSIKRKSAPDEERAALASLRRGVYAKKKIPAGTKLSREDIYFAMPILEGQLSSGEWHEGIITDVTLTPNAAIGLENITDKDIAADAVIKKAIHEVKAMLNEAKIYLNTDFEIEYSHHYGVTRFREVGAVIINIINRSYCKKIIVQLPGQVHPQHYHKRKEETFQVLSGEMIVNVEGRKRIMLPGDTCLVQPGMWHSFRTETGCIFEEISTKHYNDDSFYKDKKINSMERSERKTIVNHWGRYELPDKINVGKTADSRT